MSNQDATPLEKIGHGSVLGTAGSLAVDVLQCQGYIFSRTGAGAYILTADTETGGQGAPIGNTRIFAQAVGVDPATVDIAIVKTSPTVFTLVASGAADTAFDFVIWRAPGAVGNAGFPNAGGGPAGGGLGPAAVPLLTAGNYTLLAQTGITNLPGGSTITGVIALPFSTMGISPGAAAAITGFGLALDGGGVFSTSAQVPGGTVTASDYGVPSPATLLQAKLDMQAAYTDASGRAPDFTNLGGTEIGGMVLPPGVYKYTGVLNISQNLTLVGPAGSRWIFIAAGAVNLAVNKSIILAGGATPNGVVFASAGVTTLLAGSHAVGIFLSQTQVVMQTGNFLTGQAYAQTQIPLDHSTVTHS